MHTIAIGNFKGGVGKTTLTANLGVEFARHGRKVLLLDLDHQTDLTRLLLPHRTEFHTVWDVLMDRVPISQALVSITDNLFLLPGSPATFSPLDSPPIDLLRQKLRGADMKKRGFELVLIDTPPGISDACFLGYGAADDVLAIVTPEAFSLDNISKYVSLLSQLKRRWKRALSLLGICLNRVDNRRGLTRFMRVSMEEHYQDLLFSNHIGNNSLVPISHHERCFVRDLRFRSPVTSQFVRLAEEILRKLAERGAIA